MWQIDNDEISLSVKKRMKTSPKTNILARFFTRDRRILGLLDHLRGIRPLSIMSVAGPISRFYQKRDLKERELGVDISFVI